MRHSERISTECAANAFCQTIYVRTVKMLGPAVCFIKLVQTDLTRFQGIITANSCQHLNFGLRWPG